MIEALSRMELLIGKDALERLSSLKVILFGVGGVGSVCAESLIRSGIQNITLVDSDCVVESNLNRQLPALHSTIGRPKVQVLAERFADISPNATITPIQSLYSTGNKEGFQFQEFDIVIDAIDSLSHKIDLLATASEAGCKVFCSLGAAGKLDPTKIHTASIWETHGCPLGKLVRNGLRKRNFTGDFQAVYSDEKSIAFAVDPKSEGAESHGDSHRASVLGSAMPVTATFGLTLSSLVIRSVI